MSFNAVISGATVIVSALFAILVLNQYRERKKMHQLMWGIALALWAIGVGAEFLATLGDWSVWMYRAYYIAGALLIPAWLGLGTLYLVASRRVAHSALGIVTILSVIGILLIATWEIDPARLRATPDQFVPLKIYPFFPIQLLLIALNIFGTVAFVGGALWSTFHFVRAHIHGGRVLATVLIAIGGGIAAGAHSLGVLSGIELFRVSEFIAVLFIFAGFMLSNSPAKQ
ncbi:MAG: hypothetical protein HZC40_01055 [Chloroflexi bacterium]|nr:hypothetical protein [Chloroflexota bacterium]